LTGGGFRGALASRLAAVGRLLAGAADVDFTAFAGVGPVEAFERAATFSARDFLAGLDGVVVAGLARALCGGASCGWAGAAASAGAGACAEIRKSSIDVPRFLRPCLSHAGFGPRPLQVWPVLGWP